MAPAPAKREVRADEVKSPCPRGLTIKVRFLGWFAGRFLAKKMPMRPHKTNKLKHTAERSGGNSKQPERSEGIGNG